MKCVKCHLPGGSKNFHICLDLTLPLNLSANMRHFIFVNRVAIATNGRGVPKTEAHKRNLAEAQRRRWARIKAAG